MNKTRTTMEKNTMAAFPQSPFGKDWHPKLSEKLSCSLPGAGTSLGEPARGPHGAGQP